MEGRDGREKGGKSAGSTRLVGAKFRVWICNRRSGFPGWRYGLCGRARGERGRVVWAGVEGL